MADEGPAPKAIFWFVLFIIFIAIVIALIYKFKTGGISFLSGSSLKGIKWLH